MKINTLLAGMLGAALLVSASAAQNGPMMQGQGAFGMGQGFGRMGNGMTCAGAGGHKAGMLAYYKAELAITPEQEKLWTPFADALSKSSDDMADRPLMHHAMGYGGTMGPGMMAQQQAGAATASPFPDALDAHIAWADTHLADMKALSAAAKPLYKALSDEQKATADQMFAAPMCGF